MKKRNMLIILLIFSGLTAISQVKDISITLSPAAEYTWWDNHAGLNDGVLYGGKLGFGFGEFLELRGVYLQSYDLTTNFENFGIAGYKPSLYSPDDVNLVRWGGEFKANIGTGKLKPYITVGTGIQSFELPDKDKLEQIYASAGLGLKLNLFPRAVFLVEAKNTTYNFNAGKDFLTSADKTRLGVKDGDFELERLSNWAVQGALQFYLGGRRPGTLTELDNAYLKQFRGGLRSFQPIIEPGVAYLAFDNQSMYRNTWLMGGYAGFDFGEYIGVRGFYFQATMNDKLSADFDNLSMYGLEMRARLNDGNGVTPFLVLGGGYLNPTDSYYGKERLKLKGGEFASGGLGLNIPLGNRVLINGGARAVLTSGQNTLDITLPAEIQTHVLYNAGVKFTLGKKSKSPDVVYKENLNRDVENRMAENNRKVQQMKIEYQQKVADLERELARAYETKDVDKAVEILEDKKKAEKSLLEVEKLEKVQVVKKLEEEAQSTKPLSVKSVNDSVELSKTIVQKADSARVVSSKTVAPQTVVSGSTIQMSPAELESLIVKILGTVREKPQSVEAPEVEAPVENQQSKQQIELLNMRIEMLEKLLFDINSRMGTGNQITVPSRIDPISAELMRDFSDEILDELDDLERKVDKNADRIDDTGRFEERRAATQTVVVTPVEKDSTTDAYITSIDEKGNVIFNQRISEIGTNTTSTFIYNYTSAMLGINFGGAMTTNVGARLHYDFNNLPLDFVPEFYIGLGSSTSFGFSGNVIFPFLNNGDKVLPYAGVGLGIARIDRNLRGNYNVIIGAQLPFINKNLSFDYTMRNSFDYNQIAVSYKLPFYHGGSILKKRLFHTKQPLF